MSTERKQSPGWRHVLKQLRHRKVAVMLALGFSSGLPFMLVGNTMGFWLREHGIDLATIGFLSWVGIAYSAKYLWSPIVDKLDVPLLSRLLGRRRAWMVLAQATVAVGLFGMAVVTPSGGVGSFALMAVIAAFASATQDIVVDAWRIDASEHGEDLALLSATYQMGYRAALLVTDALILILAAGVGWAVSYEVMALAMFVGVAGAVAAGSVPQRIGALPAAAVEIDTSKVSDAMVVRWALAALLICTLVAYIVWAEIHRLVIVTDLTRLGAVAAGVLLIWQLLKRRDGPVAPATWSRPLAVPLARFLDAVVRPFSAFVDQHGTSAIIMLAAISLYRLPDFVLGPMANPFYADLGIVKETVGAVRAGPGLIATVVGITVAGLCAVRLGFMPTLLAGAVLGPGSNLAFAYLAWHGADSAAFTFAMVIDNVCTGFAGVALVGYMSSLTQSGYTATQYALLSSFYALLGKVLKGLSGVAVETLESGRTLLDAYAWFFIGTALLGIPALVLCAVLAARQRMSSM